MRPLIVGAEWFMFMYLHFASCGISVLLLFMLFLTWDWKFLVGFFFCGLEVVGLYEVLDFCVVLFSWYNY